MANHTHILHVVSHAHWDREWYQPFVGYQRRLVFLMDRLLELLEQNEHFHSFYLDGQTCMLDDYLAIRPQSEGRIREHLKSGRLEMGPWYVMPDELLVSGEALIRNLERGMRDCQKYGCSSVPLLHASDVFGHCSQMPQIMNGFGLNKTLLLRGTSADNEKSEMLWEGADGSRVWILKVFPDTGYCDVWTYRRETDSGKLQAYESRKIELSTTPILIGLDGNDHQAPFEPVLETIERMRAAFKETQVIHSSMTKALEDLDRALPAVDSLAPVFHGELRTPAKTGTWNEVFFGTASARIATKQKNSRAQQLLSRIAEPLHALAAMNGGCRDRAFLEKAWEYLLKCHPHDSIVGCSTDQVDRDVHYRLEQATEIARDQAGESLLYLGGLMAGKKAGGSEGTLVLFNPATAATGTVIPVQVEMRHDKNDTYPLPPAILDSSGNELPASLTLERRDTFPSPIGIRIEEGDYPRYGCRAHETGTVDRWSGYLRAKLEPFELRTFCIGKAHSITRESPSLVYADVAGHSLENARIRVTATKDGTFNVTDKTTGFVYRNMGQLEHQFDKGNGWDFKPVHPDKDPMTPGRIVSVNQLKVEVLENKGLGGKLIIAGIWELPTGLNISRTEPLEEIVCIPFTHTLTLSGADAFVSVRTELENKAKDMRLRLLLPTQLPVEHWWSDSAFDMVKRPVALRDTSGWKESVRPETPIHSWAAVCHDDNGIAVITQGLQEASVLDVSDRPIALTLLRCYRQAIGSGETIFSQLQGSFSADWKVAVFEPENHAPGQKLLQLVDRSLLPVQTLTIGPGEEVQRLSESKHRITIDGDLQVSSFYFRDSAFILRVYNPTNNCATGSIKGFPDDATCYETDLKGSSEGGRLVLKDGKLEIALKPKDIHTWRIRLT